jgi:hypothetical protein
MYKNNLFWSIKSIHKTEQNDRWLELLHLDFRILIRMISFLQKTSTFRCPQTGTKKGQLPVLQNLDAHVFTCLDSLKLHFKLFHRFKVILRCTLKIFLFNNSCTRWHLYTEHQETTQCFVERYLSQQTNCIRAENYSKLHKKKPRKNLLDS